MAEAARYATVIVGSTDGQTITGPVYVGSIAYCPAGSTPTATIKAADGTVIWDANSASARFYDADVNIHEPGTLTINLTGVGCKIYLYTKDRW